VVFYVKVNKQNYFEIKNYFKIVFLFILKTCIIYNNKLNNNIRLTLSEIIGIIVK
jgi:hypothetical protein